MIKGLNKCVLCKTFFHFVIKTLGKGKFQSTSALRPSFGILLLFIYLENQAGQFLPPPLSS